MDFKKLGGGGGGGSMSKSIYLRLLGAAAEAVT